jgi:hypothetical protein
MGTASTTKVIVQSNGNLQETTTLVTSAGAGDANKLPALNASGVLDASIVNSKNTSAGAGDAGKLAALNSSGILDDTIINATVTSAANKTVKTDGSGKLDITLMPTGVGVDAASIVTSEALAAGDFVNIWNSTGAKARKADATTAGKHAMGFVLSAFASAATATVYFEGTNTQVTGQTPGDVYLATTAGAATGTAPSGSGNVVQPIGIATSATSINFQYNRPITLV